MLENRCLLQQTKYMIEPKKGKGKGKVITCFRCCNLCHYDSGFSKENKNRKWILELS
jgi:hypothetical protein